MAMLLVALGGCAQGEGTTLDRDAFYRPPAGTDPQRHVLVDQPGSLNYNNVHLDLMDPNAAANALPREPPAPTESVTEISDAIRKTVTLPTGAGDAGLGGAPATLPAGAAPAPQPPRVGHSSGVAMLIGGVVCEVNGTPIYADKVLASIIKPLAAHARQFDERSFRAYALREIEKQVNVLIGAELEFAMAQQNLDSREKQYAELATARWRQEQITLAGGSLENAKARAAADGYEFDEKVADEFRTNMVRVYYQKKIFPKAQVRADDMRRYYNQNLKTEFTQLDEAQFRVIKIDIAKTGGEPQAQDKIGNLHQRAKRGEDFSALAASMNDDPMLMRAAGEVGWVQRGAYKLEALEAAVWKIQPGEVTEVIRIGDAFYIAKLENRKVGRVQPFEEQAVQEKITEALRTPQIVAMRSAQQQVLLKDAIIYPDPPDFAPVLEMAMQRYAQWASVERQKVDTR